VLACAACGWLNDYNPERIVDRLRALMAGGHMTTLAAVATRVSGNYPACARMRWRAQFGWPAGMDGREVKRPANLYRKAAAMMMFQTLHRVMGPADKLKMRAGRAATPTSGRRRWRSNAFCSELR
jgi:hypothetical protein